MNDSKSYKNIYGRDYDFKVKYQLFRPDQGGRMTSAFQGIKWDFGYKDLSFKKNQLFMIYPEFEDCDGERLSDELPIPELGIAKMFVANYDWLEFHKEKIQIGTKGTFNEGRPIGECEVIDVNFNQ